MPSPASNPVLLLIDDSPSVARLAESRLGDEPVSLHSATSAEAGIGLARMLRPDLILLDLDMPGVDGFEALRRLKTDPELLSIPVVLLAGPARAEDKLLGLELGAVDYIAKPLDAAELRARVRSALRLRRMEQLLDQRGTLDPVTGLYNERYLRRRLAAELTLARRSGLPVSIVLADIDHFRKLNAAHGPWFGDDVLRRLADAFSARVRAEDVLCRRDGAALALLLPACDANGALKLANRLRADTASLRLQPRTSTLLRLSASFGVASTHPANSTPRATDVPDEPALPFVGPAIESTPTHVIPASRAPLARSPEEDPAPFTATPGAAPLPPAALWTLATARPDAPAPTFDADSLLTSALIALTHAKQSGRDRVALAPAQGHAPHHPPDFAPTDRRQPPPNPQSPARAA